MLENETTLRNKKHFQIRNILVSFATFVILTFLPDKINNFILELPKVVEGSGNNVYNIEFSKDYKIIEKKLRMSYVNLVTFHLKYKSNGEIESYTYDLIGRAKSGKIAHATVSYSIPEKAYLVNATIVEEWKEWGRYIDANKFFLELNGANREGMKPDGIYDTYVLSSDGLSIAILDNNDPKFYIQGNRLTPLIKRHEILHSYFIRSYGVTSDNHEGPSIWYKVNAFVGG